MAEYLPGIYQEFGARYPDIAAAQGELSRLVRQTTPFDERTTHLLKFALALGAEAEGAVRSNVRKGRAKGVTDEELRAVALLAITTCGFPTAMAGLKWIDDVVERPAPGDGDDSTTP
jgi:alkylhydroperoxidase/carboxymuconolactone decarboxylase family protein YurZ